MRAECKCVCVCVTVTTISFEPCWLLTPLLPTVNLRVSEQIRHPASLPRDQAASHSSAQSELWSPWLQGHHWWTHNLSLEGGRA